MEDLFIKGKHFNYLKKFIYYKNNKKIIYINKLELFFFFLEFKILYYIQLFLNYNNIGISAVDTNDWKYLRQVSAPAFHFKLLTNKIDYIKKNAQIFI